MKPFILILAFSVILPKAFSQSITGDIEQYINNIIVNMPGSTGNNYVEPTNTQLNTWTMITSNLLENNLTVARLYADSVNYTIIEFNDTTLNPAQLFYVVEENTPNIKYWGTYIINPSSCRSKLIIQSLHPKFDYNTGSEGIFCFKRLNAKAFLLSGTHRCNHSDTTTCSGSTSVCDSTSKPFRISDMRSNSMSVYQKITEILFDSIQNSVFIQLHGFSKKTTDPYVIISNGTNMTPGTDYITQIKDELYLADTTLTFKIAHVDTTWTRLVGFTNVQGRLINGSSNPCSSAPTSTSGRFVHVEQEKTKLRQDSIGWHKMYTALFNVFNEDSYLTPISDSICQGDSILLGGSYQTIAGNYYDTLTTTAGCDSIVETTLTINPTYLTSKSDSICQGDSILLGGSYQTMAGNYYDTLTTTAGCDSIVETTLTINPTYLTSKSDSICQGDSILLGGSYQTIAGNYYDSLTTGVGCDSVIKTMLTVNGVDTSVTKSGITLTSNDTAATYQWIDCDNGNTPIPGASNQSFTVTSNGNNAVIVTKNGCSDTSSCYNITSVMIVENGFYPSIHIYPNPAKELLHIKLGKIYTKIHIDILNSEGKRVQSDVFNKKQKIILTLKSLHSGVYFIHIFNENHKTIIKLII